MDRYVSWGLYPKANHEVRILNCRDQGVAPPTGKTQLPFGNGRSYGDSCLNDGGLLLDAGGLDRFISFDRVTGILCCEAGVLLSEILRLCVPRGWFLPVTPGTQYVTVGGAIANDVHGKNHHIAGTFGRHVLRFELVRSDGSRVQCSPQEHPELYAATIGGLGLTGLITWADIALKPIPSPWIAYEHIRFSALSEFFALAQEDSAHEYTVAWIDCLARGRSLGRGIYTRGKHAGPFCDPEPLPPGRKLRVPLTPPLSLVNGISLKLFNLLYYHRQMRKTERGICHYQPFFYPLDGLLEWNRIYGPKGFLQYQCVVPDDNAPNAMQSILSTIADSGQGSFLAVLKRFGNLPSPGLMSFPRPGVTLALDFPHRGNRTLTLLEKLDDIVVEAGGAVYPAKDARMAAQRFRLYFPEVEEFTRYVDSSFSSSFWRRVTKS